MRYKLTEECTMQTSQDPNAFCFGSFGEHLHAFALTTLDAVFLTLSEPDGLGMSGKMYMPNRRVEEFLREDKTILSSMNDLCKRDCLLWGRVVHSPEGQ
jgi:hypothetical protein